MIGWPVLVYSDGSAWMLSSRLEWDIVVIDVSTTAVATAAEVSTTLVTAVVSVLRSPTCIGVGIVSTTAAALVAATLARVDELEVLDHDHVL